MIVYVCGRYRIEQTTRRWPLVAPCWIVWEDGRVDDDGEPLGSYHPTRERAERDVAQRIRHEESIARGREWMRVDREYWRRRAAIGGVP